jgi:hypothetical protein
MYRFLHFKGEYSEKIEKSSEGKEYKLEKLRLPFYQVR